jgi:hypothetical protein
MTKVATEQREHARIALAPSIVRAEVEQGGTRREGYLINVSLGGAFLTMAEPPAKNKTTKLHILLPWGVGECSVKAKTAWQQKDDAKRVIGAGVSFVDLSDDAKEKLQSYLDRYVELSAEITD